MNSNYGHLWASRFQSADMLRAAKMEWAMALGQFSAEEIGVGIQRCMSKHSKGPTLSEFIQCCKPDPEELGLPTIEDAYREATKKSYFPLSSSWSHTIVYQAGRAVGWFELKTQQEKQTRPAFNRTYKKLIEQFIAGDLDQADHPNRLEKHKNGAAVMTEENKAASEKHLARLKGSFKVGAA